MTDSLYTGKRLAEPLRGAKLVMPGKSDLSKLPLPPLPESLNHGDFRRELAAAWTQYIVNRFKQNEQMFHSTLDSFVKPYRLTVCLYATLFGIGIGLFVVAAVIGLGKGGSVVAIAFAGLNVAAFTAFFIRQPLHAPEKNFEFITWLGVAFNIYRTRLMYMADRKTVQTELKAPEADFRASVEQLITRHAELRNKRPGGS